MREIRPKNIRAGGKSRLILYLIGTAAILILIVLIKSRTAVIFKENPLIYFYGIFVTTFELSRLGISLLYKKPKPQAQYKNAGDYEPRVSIIVPCKNEEEEIVRTVKKCMEAEYPKNKFEVIVINDGSTDLTAQKLYALREEMDKKDRERFTLIDWKENRGKRKAMAEGIRRSKGEIIIQLDSDSYIEPATFRGMVAPFIDKEIGGISAHTDPANAGENSITKMQAAYYFMSFRILKAAESAFQTVLCLSGCASAYRKEVIMPILDKWVEEKFFGLPVTWGDDRALTSWVLREGHKTIYTDAVKAWTVVPNNVKKLLRQQLRWKKSYIINSIFTSKFMLFKHPFFSVFYYFPLIAITFLTPFVIIYSLIYIPISNGILPTYYLFGIFSVTTLTIFYYRFLNPKNPYWPYLYAWSAFNAAFLSFLLIVAMVRLRDRGWGTR